MKKSISQWAFKAGLKLEECFRIAKDAGFDGVEVAMDEYGEISFIESGKEDIQKIVDTAKKYSIEIAGLATGLFWKYSMTSDDKDEREKAKNIVIKMIEIASYLETDTILVVPGAVDVPFIPNFKVVSYDKVYERSLKTLGEIIPFAEKYKVNIGIENVWNGFLLSPLETRDFIDKLGSKYIGVYFDVGNVILFGFPEQWIRILGSRIKRVHLKDFRKTVGTLYGFVNLLYGDVNWKEVMNALKETGYNSFLTAEVCPSNHYPESIIYETSIAIDRILKGSI